MADFDEQQPSSEDMAALELYHQLLNLSPDDGDRTLMVTLRTSTGRYVGDVWLSQPDTESLADMLLHLNIRRADATEGLIPAEPLPELDGDDAGQVDAMVTALENIANGGQA